MSRPSTRQVAAGTFAANFASALGERTSESFAREIDVSLRTVQRWRAGEGTPSVEQALKVAAALGRSVESLFPDQKEAA